MVAGFESGQLTRRQRELAERPFCIKCGVNVVRETSELINGQLWCLVCYGTKSQKAGSGQNPKSKKRRRKSSLRKKRRGLLEVNSTCAYCGCELTIETATIDHVVPRSKGGSNAIDNLVLACQPCNVGKADKEFNAAERHQQNPATQ